MAKIGTRHADREPPHRIGAVSSGVKRLVVVLTGPPAVHRAVSFFLSQNRAATVRERPIGIFFSRNRSLTVAALIHKLHTPISRQRLIRRRAPLPFHIPPQQQPQRLP